MSRVLVPLFLVVALLGWAAAAHARPAERGHSDGGPGRFLDRHAAELGLDPATLERVQAILADSRAEGRALRGELDAAHEAMRGLLDAEPPDLDAVLGQADVIGALETEHRKQRLRAMVAIQLELSPEQRARFREMRERTAGKHGPRGRSELRAACRDDRERLCADVAHGPPAIACMREHEDDLSEACRTALRDKRSRQGPPPPR